MKYPYLIFVVATSFLISGCEEDTSRTPVSAAEIKKVVEASPCVAGQVRYSLRNGDVVTGLSLATYKYNCNESDSLVEQRKAAGITDVSVDAERLDGSNK